MRQGFAGSEEGDQLLIIKPQLFDPVTIGESVPVFLPVKFNGVNHIDLFEIPEDSAFGNTEALHKRGY